MVVATSFGLEDDAVVVPGLALYVGDVGLGCADLYLVSAATKGIGMSKFGVQVTQAAWGFVPRRFIQFLVIDVEVLAVLPFTFVDQLHDGAPGKGHGCITAKGCPSVEMIRVCR
jgi:hypothetical protein